MQIEDLIEAHEDAGSVVEFGKFNAAYNGHEFDSTTGDDLISTIGQKIPTCQGGCDLNGTLDDTRTIENEKGKTIRICNHCGDNIRFVNADRYAASKEAVATGAARPILFPRDIKSQVFRYLDSPWGRLRVNISVNSFFAASVIAVDERVTEERTRINKRESLYSEQEGYPTVMIVKRLIDSEFANELVQEAFLQQSGDWFDFSNFIERLKGIIKSVHLDPQAASEFDEIVDGNLRTDWKRFDERGALQKMQDRKNDAMKAAANRTMEMVNPKS
jgi:hypothetical protein